MIDGLVVGNFMNCLKKLALVDIVGKVKSNRKVKLFNPNFRLFRSFQGLLINLVQFYNCSKSANINRKLFGKLTFQ
jgi:hypothetical protein